MKESHLYRQDLPHIECPGKTYFVTFCTHKNWTLPPPARDVVLETIRLAHEKSCNVHCAIAMPDHVHLLLTPIGKYAEEVFGLARILKGIKGASAKQINVSTTRTGPVWQSESFDHILRSDESCREKANYIRMNPVRRHLVSVPEEYKWYWEPEE